MLHILKYEKKYPFLSLCQSIFEEKDKKKTELLLIITCCILSLIIIDRVSWPALKKKRSFNEFMHQKERFQVWENNMVDCYAYVSLSPTSIWNLHGWFNSSWLAVSFSIQSPRLAFDCTLIEVFYLIE